MNTNSRLNNQDNNVAAKEPQLHLVLQSMPVAILITDQQGYITFVNKEAELLFGYYRDELVNKTVEILVPDALKEQHVRHRQRYSSDPYVRAMGSGMNLVGLRKDGQEIPIEVGLNYIESNGTAQIIASITDITVRKETEKSLEYHVQKRTQELSSLLQSSQNVASTLDLEPLLDSTLDQLKTVIDFNEGAVLILEGGSFKVTSYRGSRSQTEALRFKVSVHATQVDTTLLQQKKPIVLHDIQSNEPLANFFNQAIHRSQKGLFKDARSWAWIPLVAKDQIIGALALSCVQRNYFSEEQIQLAFAFANQLVVAIRNAQLYSQVKQHSNQLESMFLVHQAITSRLDPEAILQLIADSALRLTKTRLSVVYLIEGPELRIAAISGEHNKALFVGNRIPFSESAVGTAIQSGRPILIKNIKDNNHADIEPIKSLDLCCYLAVPMLSVFESIGIIAVGDRQDGVLGTQDEETLMMLASGAVIGLENARLYHRERERRREAEQRRRVAESLRDMLTVLNSDRSINEILDYIVLQASQVLDARGSAVFRLEEDNHFTIQAGYGLSVDNEAKTSEAMNDQHIRETLLSRQPIVLSNLRDASTGSGNLWLKDKLDLLLVNGFRAVLAVPLIVKDNVYGNLAVYYNEPREFSTDEIDLAITFCDQAALAVENARLKTKVEEIAVATERHRLARDLHDAVTQSLFSASLIADILPRLWDRDQDEARRRLAELRQLTRGAMAEMRTLLLELRPAALIEGRLREVIRHLTEAVNSRTQTAISLTVEGDQALPPDVQVGLYRITQEALNNVVKHAKANQATVNLNHEPDQVVLRIEDDGRGFDTNNISSEHLGVGIMRERAENIGASLKLLSQKGKGTSIEVAWPAFH